jgi:hypothetical protein
VLAICLFEGEGIGFRRQMVWECTEISWWASQDKACMSQCVLHVRCNLSACTRVACTQRSVCTVHMSRAHEWCMHIYAFMCLRSVHYIHTCVCMRLYIHRASRICLHVCTHIMIHARCARDVTHDTVLLGVPQSLSPSHPCAQSHGLCTSRSDMILRSGMHDDMHMCAWWHAHVCMMTCTCVHDDMHMCTWWHAHIYMMTCTCVHDDMHMCAWWCAMSHVDTYM